MRSTPTPLPQNYVDHVTGLRYLSRLGPELPALNVEGLDYVRSDALARAAAADAQGSAPDAPMHVTLFCAGEAAALRQVAAQIVQYALDPAWQQQ
jgi:hypothetical protein